MKPLGDHLLHWLSIPLRSHVTNTSDGDEVEALILLDESFHLLVRGPLSPCLFDGPIQILNPSSCAFSCHSTVGVSWEVHQSQAWLLEHSVNPDGSLVGKSVVQSITICTNLPLRISIWDMKSRSSFSRVQVVWDKGSKNWFRVVDLFLLIGYLLNESVHRGLQFWLPLFGTPLLDPWGILRWGVASLVMDLFSINSCHTQSSIWALDNFWAKKAFDWTIFGWGSNQIINVEILDILLHFVHDRVTLVRVPLWSHISEKEVTIIVVIIFLELWWDQVESSECVSIDWSSIPVPTSGSITNHETFYVDLCAGDFFKINLSVELENLPGKVWDIDTSIALSRHVKLITDELWEFFIPTLYSFQSIFRLEHIIGD